MTQPNLNQADSRLKMALRLAKLSLAAVDTVELKINRLTDKIADLFLKDKLPKSIMQSSVDLDMKLQSFLFEEYRSYGYLKQMTENVDSEAIAASIYQIVVSHNHRVVTKTRHMLCDIESFTAFVEKEHSVVLRD